MKLLIICAVLSVCVAVSLASPVKTQVRDGADSSASAESRELTTSENDSSSSEEEREETKVKDASTDISEEEAENNEIVKDALNENTSVEEQELADDFITSRAKRAVICTPHSSNQLFANDEATIKNEKRLKLGLIDGRNKRSTDTSEENSSEEDQNAKGQKEGAVIANKHKTVPAENLQLAPKPDTAPAESLAALVDIRRKRNSASPDSSEENSSEEEKQEAPAKGVITDNKLETAPAESNPKNETLRRRRSAIDFSEEDQSLHAQNDNEVFISSKEEQTDVEDNNEDFDSIEQLVLGDKTFGTPQSSAENNNSEEDYAQGCGGNRSDNSNGNSNEKDEILNDNLHILSVSI